MSIKQKIAENKLAIAGGVGVAAAAAPTLAFAEGETNAATSAITTMAGSIASEGQSMFTAVLPVMTPLIAAGLIIGLGIVFVRKLTNKAR